MTYCAHKVTQGYCLACLRAQLAEMTELRRFAEEAARELAGEVERLRAALTKHASQGLAGDGLCWCFYVRCVHPEDDPQDSVKTRDGHTEDCWAVRLALAAQPAATGEGSHD